MGDYNLIMVNLELKKKQTLMSQFLCLGVVLSSGLKRTPAHYGLNLNIDIHKQSHYRAVPLSVKLFISITYGQLPVGNISYRVLGID